MTFDQTRRNNHHEEACLNCYAACVEALPHCLMLGGRYAESKHVAVLQQCSEMARLTFFGIMNNSSFIQELTLLCAKMCKATISSCEDIDKVDPVLNRCIRACWECITVLSEKTPVHERHESDFKPPHIDQYD